MEELKRFISLSGDYAYTLCREAAEQGTADLIYLAVVISMNLGVMNLLPLPALDGGRLLFIILEIIRGKKIPPEKEGMVHLVGLVLLLALMMVVMGNDIRKIIMG